MAELNIDSFIGALRSGGQRVNLFRITMNSPDAPVPDNFSFMAKASSLPGTNQGIIEVPYQGRTYKIPGDKTFNEWNITVMDDEGLPIRSFFEEWSDKINSNRENLTSNVNPFSHMADCTIEALTKDGNVSATYTMKGVWPSAIAEIAMAWDSNDSIAEFDVTLQVQYFERS